MLDRRPKIVVYGACQSHFLVQVVKNVPALAERFHFIEVLNYAPPGQPVPEIPDCIDGAVLVWEQYDKRDSVERRDKVRERLSDVALRINFPMLTFFSPWPFLWFEPRGGHEPEFPFGRYPWGDRIALRVAKMGLSADDAYKTYLRLSSEVMPDVTELLARDRLAAARRDENCDVKMSDVIYDSVLSEHLFWAWGHVADTLISELATRLCRRSREILGPLTIEVVRDLKRASLPCPGQGKEQHPINPTVGEMLGLKYCGSDQRYYWFGNSWTFEEYIKRYIAFDISWPSISGGESIS